MGLKSTSYCLWKATCVDLSFHCQHGCRPAAAVSMAQNSNNSLAALPQCSVTCMANALAHNSTCSPSNTTCLCTDALFQNAMAACTTASCTVKESLTTLNLTNTLCNVPVRDRTDQIRRIAIVGIVLAAVPATMRFIQHYRRGLLFTGDDVSVVFAMISRLLPTQQASTQRSAGHFDHRDRNVISPRT